MTRIPELARLGDRVPDLPDEVCWPWQGNIAPSGHGQAYDPFTQRTAGAHRVVWKLLNGAIPDGMHIDHVCHDPETCTAGDQCPHRRCVNPHHIACVPQKANVLRSNGPSARNAEKTHCKRGHEFTPENTHMVNLKRGQARRCRTCHVERQRQQVIDRGGKPRPLRRTYEGMTA